jgi:hypothetical protein
MRAGGVPAPPAVKTGAVGPATEGRLISKSFRIDPQSRMTKKWALLKAPKTIKGGE